MLRRAVFILTTVLSLIVGGAVVYLFMSIPNDLRAESLLAQARADLQKEDRDAAREKLTTIVRDYPRTDAAAAASFALFRLLLEDRRELQRRVTELEKRQKDLTGQLAQSGRQIEELAKRPVPEPPKAAPAKPAPARPNIIRRSTPPKKTTPKRSAPRRRRSDLFLPQNPFAPEQTTSLSLS